MDDEQARIEEQRRRSQAQFGATAQAYVESPRHRSGRDLERLVELAECRAGDEALDIATGGGHTALAIAPHVASVVASDLTPQMLEAAEAFVRGTGTTNVAFQQTAAEELPFANESFDIVTCRIAPHHFGDVAAFCREVARVLRPGGRFVLMDSHAPEDDEFDRFINEVEWRRDTSHARSYRVSEWRELIESVGLQIDVVEEFERRFEFGPWTERSRMSDEERDELERMILDAPQRVKERFSIEVKDGRLDTFADLKFLLRARKT